MTSALPTRVEVTNPAHPIAVGGVLAIQCQIWNMEDGHTVKILRVTSQQTDEITSADAYMNSWLGQRVFLSIRSLPGGIRVYFLTILNASFQDAGEYLCNIVKYARGVSSVVTFDSVDIKMHSVLTP